MMKTRFLDFCAKIGSIGLLTYLTGHSLSAQTTLTGPSNGFYNTGVLNDGSLAPLGAADLHYRVDRGPSFVTTTLAANWAKNSFVGTPFAGLGNSQWISIAGGNFVGQTNTIYNYSLPLSNIPAGKLITITATVALDNSLRIFANSTGAVYTSGFKSSNFNNTNLYQNPAQTTFSAVSGAQNSLIFEIFDGNGPTGLQVQLTGSYAELTDTTGLGIQIIPIVPLTPNQTVINNAINTINVVGVNNASFAGLTGALAVDTQLGGALDQLSPEKLGLFANIAFNNASFLNLDLDDYLAHRRNTDAEGFRPSSTGLNTSGITLNEASLGPILGTIKSQLFAWNPPAQTTMSDLQQPLLAGTTISHATDPVLAETNDPLSKTSKWSLFLRGNAVLGQNFSGPDLAHTESTTGSFQLGADYQVTSHLLCGVVLSYFHTDTELDQMGSSGTVDSYAPGLYASYAQNGWFLNGLVHHGFDSYTEHRNISIGNGLFAATAHASPTGSEDYVYVDGGHDFYAGNWTLGPMVGVQYVHFGMNAIQESGAGGANLRVEPQDAQSIRSRLGGRVSYFATCNHYHFTPHLSASWQHEFSESSRPLTASFSEVGGSPFTVQTASASPESALVNTGIDVDLNQTVTVFANYEIQAGASDYFGQLVQVGCKFAF